MVRFYPTLRLFVIGVLDANVAFNDVLRNGAIRFPEIFGALPLFPIHLQVSDRLVVQDVLGPIRVDEV